MAGGFFGAMPCGGGTSQTAVNATAGARTQVAGLVTAAGALATMLFLAPAMGALPYATLAAVVVAYSVGLIDPAEMEQMAISVAPAADTPPATAPADDTGTLPARNDR